MILIVAALTATLLVIALLHLAWGLGVRWPVGDETRLVATVIGIRGQTTMPTLGPCVAVAVALAVVATLVFRQALTPGPFTRLALIAAAAVFLARAIAPWLPVWRRLTPQQPFARLDRLVYGPLCLLIAAGLAAVVAETP